jgi:Uncharacterized homolog of phage Mu protein gp47
MSESNKGITWTPQGIEIADPDDIMRDLKQIFIDAFALQGKSINMDKLHTPQGQIASSLTAAINNKNIDVLKIVSNFDIDKAEGIYLDALCKLSNIFRIAASPTLVEVICRGLSGIVINGKNSANPSRVSDISGNTYVAKESMTIAPGGTVVVIFENERPGAIECLAGSISTIETRITGWDSVENANDGIMGNNVESDAALRIRFKALRSSVLNPIISKLQNRVLQIPDVIDAVAVQNNTNQPNTIFGYTLIPNSYAVSVLGGSNADIALAILIYGLLASQNGNTVESVADENNNIYYPMRFIRPDRLDYFFRVNIIDNPTLPSSIDEMIKDAIYDNFYSERVRIASTTFNSRFFAALQNSFADTNISLDVTDIKIAVQPNGGSKTPYSNSAVCNLNQYPSLSKSNIEVIISA